MFGNKKEETLDSILGVFIETKTKLTNFIDEKSKEKERLEATLTGVNSDLDKSTDVLENINKLTA